MGVVFTSKRLTFKTFEPGDGALIYQLNSDPDVLTFLHENPISLQEAERVVEQVILPQYKKYNHGRWAVYQTTTGEFMGWCGLKYREEEQITDLGYRFKKQFWGQGFASEAAERCVHFGFHVLGITSLFGAAHVNNIASQKVLEKTGFQFVNTRVIDGCLAKTYMLQNPNLQ